MYLIEEGRLRLMRSNGGRAVHVATLAAGETFGVVSALRGTPRTTTVEAVTPVRLRTLSGETVEHLAAALPSVRATLDDWVAQHDYQHLRGRSEGRRPGTCRLAPRALIDRSARATSTRASRRAGQRRRRHRPPPPARAVHPAGRRDRLRRRVPRDGGARLRSPSEPRTHSPTGEHRPRRHQPALNLPCRRRAGAGHAVGQDLGTASRSHGASSDRALG